MRGYTITRNDRFERRGGGTAVYIRDSITFTTLNMNGRLPTEIEGTFIDIPFFNLGIICVYIPPKLSAKIQTDVKNCLDEIIDDYVNTLPSREIIVLGDFNDFETARLTDDHNLTDIVTAPTRGKNVLDHILISEGLIPTYMHETSLLRYESPIGKSDHLSLILSPATKRIRFKVIRVCEVYDYRLSNIQRLTDKAIPIDWENLVDPNADVDQQWNTLLSEISDIVNECIPKKTILMTSNDKCWMTPITKMLIDEKWNAFRTKDWQRFKVLKCKVATEIKKAKSIWANKLMSSSPSGLWKVTKQLSGKECKNQLQNLITQCHSPQNLAETVATSMTNDDPTPKPTLDLNDDTWSVNVRVNEVMELLRKLPPNKSSGCDNIPNKIYSLLSSYIAAPLSTIFNSSISQRKFPSGWKKGIVVPIPKTNPPMLHKLRTLTLLPAPSKILEKLILSKMQSCIDPLFGPTQHAYRRGLSTTTALLQLFDTLTRIYDDPHFHGLILLSLDFSKAFDLVDHTILLDKMSSNLPHGFLMWVKSYLSNRSFRVKIQGNFSKERVIQSGVPQGSVLGPALFSILVGDLTSNRYGNAFVQYADDVNIVIPLETKEENEIKQKLDDQMNEIEDWCTKNKQNLNTAKTKVMVTRRSKTPNNFCTPLTVENKLKILGVYFNNKLNWEDHINAVNRKMCQRLNILRVLKRHVTQDELHQVYIALVRSVADYCCPVFVRIPFNLNRKLQRLERRAHRLIFGNERKCACDLDGFVLRRRDLSGNLFINY